MEKLSTKGTSSEPAFFRKMAVLAVIVAVSLGCTGCGKDKPPVVSAAPEQNTNQTAETAPVYQPPAPTAPVTTPAITEGSTAGPDLRELDRDMIRWIVSNKRRPKNFEDFAATSGIVIPPPPVGKKYVLDKTMHIQLVDR